MNPRNVESPGSTGTGTSRTIGSIPVTPTCEDLPEDGHVDAGSVTQAFKGKDSFSFKNSPEETKFDQGARFLKRFRLTVKNNKNLIFRAILEPQDGVTPLPESHVSAVFTMLFMLVEGPAAAIVERYESNCDGVAAYRALERAVEQHASDLFLPGLMSQIRESVFPAPNVDPADFLAVFTGLQRDLARHAPYSIETQIAEIMLLLSTPETEKYSRLLENKYDDVDTLVDKINNHWNTFIRIRSARREPERRQVVAGIDMHEGDDNTQRRQPRGRGGGGGARGGARGGGGGARGGGGGAPRERAPVPMPPRVSRGHPTGKCWLCDSPEHKIADCPRRSTAIEHVAAVKAQEADEGDEGDDCEQAAVQPQPRGVQPRKIQQPRATGSLGAVRKATCDEQIGGFGDVVCGVHTAPAATSMTASALVTIAVVFIFFSFVFAVLSVSLLWAASMRHGGVYHGGVSNSDFNSTSVAALRHSPTRRPKCFVMDTGASVSVSNRIEDFETLDTTQTPAATGVATDSIRAAGVGTVRFCPTDINGLVVPIIITGVWYIPRQPHCLMSVSKLEDVGATVETNTKKRRRERSLGKWRRLKPT